MADDINKKISIDVEISTDGQQQINQYKASFDSLRTSINTLDKDLASFSDSVNKLNSQNQSLSDSGNKVKETVTSLSETFGIWQKAIDFVKAGVISLEDALSGGLAILVTFAPEILKWIGNMIQGNTTLSALNKTLKDNKIVMDAVNATRLQGIQNAQGELVSLKLLYNASQDHNLSLKERKKAVAEIQQQYPAYFGNLSSENILTGKATKNYDDLAAAIVAASKARAATEIITSNQVRQIGNTDKLKKLNDETTALQKKLDAAQKEYDKDAKYQDNSASSLTGGGAVYSNGLGEINDLQDKIAANKKLINNLTTDSGLLDKQNLQLSKDVADDIKKSGVGIITTYHDQTAALDKYSKKIDEVKKKTSSPAKPATTSGDKFPAPKQDATAPAPDADDQALLNTPAIDDAQKTSDALKQIESQRIHDMMVQGDAARAAKLAKEKEAAQQLKDFEIQTAQQVSTAAFGIVQNGIKQQADAKIAALEKQKNAELANSNLTSSQKAIIEAKYKKQEDKVKAKAFKEEQEASLAQAVINGALAITKATSQTGVLSPFVIPGIIAETAIQVATIVAQKPPAYASGGLHYTSDGKGGLLPGYSRTDNTNAYLRSGEGIVVSEAMRNPWARNLVSAINVGFGGRDFSTTATGRGFAVGGIFTDGGDANRYYNAPVNDQKNLANSIAYQMVNNFPPVYVDVKDINNQQNILAQTINRVNL